jgi:hypothetical protein
MTHDEMKLLTPAERAEFRALEKMFEGDGWQFVMSRMQEEQDIGPEYFFWNATCWEDIIAARARIRAVLELANFETMTENRKANLIQGRQFEAVDKLEDESLKHL